MAKNKQVVERRNVNVVICRTGGNSGPNSFTYKLPLPTVWCKKMDVKPEDRSFIIEFDEANEVISLIRQRADDTDGSIKSTNG